MDLKIAREPWMERSLCAGMTYPENNIFFEEGREDEAKALCAMCEVRDECLDFALRKRYNEEWDGIYAGLTPRERRTLLKKKRKLARQRGEQ